MKIRNIPQCICQDSNQQYYRVLFNIMSPSNLYNTLKSASEAIYRFTFMVSGLFFPYMLYHERAFRRLNWILGWSTSTYAPKIEQT